MVGTSRSTEWRVELVRWPAEAERRTELAARGVPRLLLVAEGVAPPQVDRDEDWIRTPADERDVWVRLRRLAVLDERRRRRPCLDGDVVVAGASRSTAVSPADAALLRLLVDRFGELVLWDDLAAAVAATRPAPATQRALRSQVARLRSRLRPVALVIHAVRGRGVLLDHAEPI